MEQVLFVLAAAGVLAGGIGVIASRQPVRSALALLLVLGSLSVDYLLLSAQFIAALQVIIYAGAIVVLFLFVIMLLNMQSGEGRTGPSRRQRILGGILGVIFLILLISALLSARGTPVAISPDFGTAEAVGRHLLTTYVLPFEIASMILLVGIVAAVVLGKFPLRQLSPSTRVPHQPVAKG